MSRITGTETLSLMEAYQAVYNDDLREELQEEEALVEQVGIDMIENAAYVLFSQGYDVDDVISYFTEASTNRIIEDYINFSEGHLIIESVAVSDAYIEEQFEILNENALGFLAKQGGRLVQAGKNIKNALTPAAKAPVKNFKSPLTTKLSQGSKPPVTPSTAAAKPGMLQKAGNFAKGVMTKAKEVVKKIPGAGTVAKIAKSPVGKIASKALPGLGAAAYGIDAADRAKKGDWGGAALSGLGAVTSAIPGAGLVAGLAPAAIQAGTDALGLTGDKSRKGSAKTAPAGPPSLKGKQDFAKSKGKYYSSSDQKTYKNYNDAEAAKNSRRGVKPTPTPTPAASSSPAPAASSTPAPSSTPAKQKVAPTKPASTPDTKLTPMQQWAAKNPTLAAKVKPGQSGYDDISAKRDKPGPNEKQDQTPTQGNPEAKIDPKAVGDALKAQQERDKNKAKPQAVNASYEYDAYDLVLEYLLSQGHTETVEEANYVMMEMDAEMIGTIVEAAADQSDKQIDKGVKTTYKAGNTIDNQHQGKSRGLSRLPANERAAKTKRMQGRLKARRDDLFGERNNREDSKREQLKKMLGL